MWCRQFIRVVVFPNLYYHVSHPSHAHTSLHCQHVTLAISLPMSFHSSAEAFQACEVPFTTFHEVMALHMRFPPAPSMSLSPLSNLLDDVRLVRHDRHRVPSVLTSPVVERACLRSVPPDRAAKFHSTTRSTPITAKCVLCSVSGDMKGARASHKMRRISAHEDFKKNWWKNRKAPMWKQAQVSRRCGTMLRYGKCCVDCSVASGAYSVRICIIVDICERLCRHNNTS